MSFICMRMKNHFHIKGWALNLVLIQMPGGTRKWPPIAWRSNSQFVPKKFILGSCSTVYKLQRLTTFISTDLMIFFPSLSAFRLVTAKSMVLVDQWKKVSHSNLVSLREVFTTKAFGDNCKYSNRMHFCYVVVVLQPLDVYKGFWRVIVWSRWLCYIAVATKQDIDHLIERHLTIYTVQKHVFI